MLARHASRRVRAPSSTPKVAVLNLLNAHVIMLLYLLLWIMMLFFVYLLADLLLSVLQKLTHARLNLAQTMQRVSIFLEEALDVLARLGGLENAVISVSSS